MATGTDAGGTWNTNAGNKTVTATPAVDDLIVVVHGISTWASGDNSVITDNNPGGAGTYERLGTATAPLSTGGGTSCALWISVRTALITSADSTVFTATNTGDTGGGLTVLRFSGMTRTGLAAIRQFKGESSQTENPPTITFNVPLLTGNPVILAVMGEDNVASVTPPAGFSEADDTGWNVPTTGIEVCWADSGNATSELAWSGGSLTDHNEGGIELDTSTALGTVIKDLIGAGIIPRPR